MKVKIFYCDECKKQTTAYWNGGYSGQICPSCNEKNRIGIFETEVQIPKPHIEPGTLVKVWDKIDQFNKPFFAYFIEFHKDGRIVTQYHKGTGANIWENYELITPDEINPNIKKEET